MKVHDFSRALFVCWGDSRYYSLPTNHNLAKNA